MKRVYYRVKTGFGIADINKNTLEDARAEVATYNQLPEDNEHFQYWEDAKAKLTIVKVTEIEEDINNMFNDDNLEDGCELVAINRCVVQTSGVSGDPALIIGKVYTIEGAIKIDSDGDQYVTINSELTYAHRFSLEELEKFFIPNKNCDED